MELAGHDLLEFGNEFQLTGVVYNKGTEDVILYFEDPGVFVQESIKLTTEQWQTLIRQTDLLEVNVEERVGGKLIKGVARKTQRQIDQQTSWAVYRRDNYSCRYCGADDVPLTVDHLVTWEKGGPSTLENLVSSCKKCNRTRGNMEYADWLETDYYRGVATKLSKSTLLDNWNLAATLADIPRVKVMRKR
jgi:5-methylcytosine-specific restriction endonuclease McrA